ncbi:MAG: branched-chain amino acid transport [Frankiales bacterium]|nr:branched-chain amino acid transport [Frankiales bacterium]
MIWTAVLLGSLGCYLLKLAGWTVPPGLLARDRVRRAATLLPLALLAALVVVQSFADGDALVLDARAAGLGVAGVLVLLRAPFLVVVLAAATTAAVLRL